MRTLKIRTAIAVTALFLLPHTASAQLQLAPSADTQEQRLVPASSRLALGLAPTAPVTTTDSRVEASSNRPTQVQDCVICGTKGGPALPIVASAAGLVAGGMIGAAGTPGDIGGALMGGLIGSVVFSTVAGSVVSEGDKVPLLGSIVGSGLGLFAATVSGEAAIITYPVIQGLFTYAASR